MPGFGGQSFDRAALAKLKWLSDWTVRERKPLFLEVDGGINTQTIGACAAAGTGLFVVGSGIFRQPDYQLALRDLRALALTAQGSEQAGAPLSH
jgi:ribulose-phosphate 3-epimerase